MPTLVSRTFPCAATVLRARVNLSRPVRLGLCPPRLAPFQRPPPSFTCLCRLSLTYKMASRIGTRRGSGTTLSARRPSTSCPPLWDTRESWTDVHVDDPMALQTCPKNSMWSCTSFTNFPIGLIPKRSDQTDIARRKLTQTRCTCQLNPLGN